MKDKIVDLYFNRNLKQIEIANTLGIAKSTVSKVLQKDARFISEKNSRKLENKIKHNKDIQNRVETKRKEIQFEHKVDDLILKHIHRQATMELSKNSHLSDESYRKWNSSAYIYNPSKHRYEYDSNLIRSYAVPKYIKER